MADHATQNASALEVAIAEALHGLSSGPTLGAFGIAREDCALVHMDYFVGIESAILALSQALAEARSTTTGEILREFGNESRPCDCESCAGKEAAEAARQKSRAAYTNVKEWKA